MNASIFRFSYQSGCFALWQPLLASFVWLSLFLVSCSEDPNSSQVNDAPATTHFYAKWIDADSLEIFFSFGSWDNLPDPESRLKVTVARIYQGPSPEGPWVEVSRTTPNAHQGSFMSGILVQSSSELNYFRLEYDIVTLGENRVFHGPIITTVKPYQRPSEWESGATLKASANVYIFNGVSSCLSSAAAEIFVPSDKGMFFNPIDGKQLIGNKLYDYPNIQVHLDWIDTVVVFSGHYISLFSQRNLEVETFGFSSSYSYRMHDTSFVYNKDNVMYRYNLRNSTVFRDSTIRVPPVAVSMTVASPSNRYYGCVSSFAGTAGSLGGWRLLDANLQPLAALYPLGDYRDDAQFFRLREPVWDKTPLYMQWADGDDQVYFWTDWSGCMEIWSYSITQKRYRQITGYSSDQYPGTYYKMSDTYIYKEIPIGATNHHSTSVYTINFLYHPVKKKLMLFFRQGDRDFAVRYADLPQ